MDMALDLVLTAPGEIDTGLLTEPTEVTTRRLPSMGQRSALKTNSETRGILRGVKEIEATRDVRQRRGMQGADRKLLRVITLGG